MKRYRAIYEFEAENDDEAQRLAGTSAPLARAKLVRVERERSYFEALPERPSVVSEEVAS